jgi:hypothetical protein
MRRVRCLDFHMHKKFLYPVASLCLAAGGLFAESKVDFHRDIEPLFKDRCLDCHGPDKQKSELRLDRRVSLLRGGDLGVAALVPGDPGKSFMIEAIKGVDPDMLMPPKGKPLTKDQVALIEQWVAEGAEWPGQMDAEVELRSDFWSLQPVRRPGVPHVASARNEVDAFLLEKLVEKNLTFNPPADPRSLIRRTAILLTGLPPVPERIQAFVAEYQADPDKAFHALVEELLASPHFGERWAQHWLDVIRWAETNGSEANLYRKNAWVFRDYVVRAFNQDTPYDRFVREQLAGDQLGMGEATGFLVSGPHVPAATVGAEPSAIRQARADRMDEIMQTVGASMLGMSVGCARCHNHKFDPISIKDYYALTAVFQGVEFGGRYPEYAKEHPLRQRADALWRDMARDRAYLRKTARQWNEDWGGFRELHFTPFRAKVVRMHFVGGWGRLDELEIMGPAQAGNENYALDAEGTRVTEGDNVGQGRAPLANINDGYYGTMGYQVKAVKGSRQKPWVRFEFPEVKEIGRVRISSNREYFNDTDYLDKKAKVNFGDYQIEIQGPDGRWKAMAGTRQSRKQVEQDPERQAAFKGIAETIARLVEEGPRPSFVGRLIKPKVTHVLHRGSPEDPRDEVNPAGFAILGGDLALDGKANGRVRRLRFAEWLTRPEHPLTARVMVNRIWHHVFGNGLVSTTADFGKAGAPPSHPELLDWLVADWLDAETGTPWSMKKLIRHLVTTEAFRQSSRPREDGLAADSGARLLWRFPPRRVEAEVLRDGILQASGKLDPRIGGRSFRIHNVKKTYAQWEVVDNHGPETWRRMLYQERMRRVDDRIFTAFDFPDCGQVRAKRPVSTTPLQALNLMNSPFAMNQAGYIAERARREAGQGGEAAVIRAYALLLGREPDADELVATTGIDLKLVCRSIINANEFAFLP